jgi:hypothetical protein
MREKSNRSPKLVISTTAITAELTQTEVSGKQAKKEMDVERMC